jgi:hypothetical protein
LPDTIPLNDEQFKSFLQTTLLHGFARKTLDSYTVRVAEVTPPPAVPDTPAVAEESEVVTL